MSWILTIFGIVALIVLHELGHFTAAKLVGMRVERFSLFFPPTIAKIRRGETEYALGALPLGGYVKIAGMSPEELDGLEPELARRAYYAQSPWKRVVVILAGPAVNLLIAFVIFWAILGSGSLTGDSTLESLNPSIQTRVPTTSVGAVIAHSAAQGVLHAGDRIIAVDGHPASVSSTVALIGAHRCAGRPTNGCIATSPVKLTVRRGQRTLTILVRPHYSSEARRMLVGFEFGVAPKHFGVLAAAGSSLHEMWSTTTSTVTNLVHAFTSEKVRKQLHSIVGITEIAHETVLAGTGYALVFLGFISLVLAVINLFPFLPLDGGHILWAVAEKVRGRPISLAAMYRYSSVGIVLLLFLVVNGVGNDISRLTH